MISAVFFPPEQPLDHKVIIGPGGAAHWSARAGTLCFSPLCRRSEVSGSCGCWESMFTVGGGVQWRAEEHAEGWGEVFISKGPPTHLSLSLSLPLKVVKREREKRWPANDARAWAEQIVRNDRAQTFPSSCCLTEKFKPFLFLPHAYQIYLPVLNCVRRNRVACVRACVSSASATQAAASKRSPSL